MTIHLNIFYRDYVGKQWIGLFCEAWETVSIHVFSIIFVVRFVLQYFTGKWYEQKRFWAIFEIGSRCVNAEYTPKPNGMVEVKNSGTSLK